MIPYIETEMPVDPRDREILAHASTLVDRCPSKYRGSGARSPGDGEAWVRCHELARAVGRVLDLEVVDGSYGASDHSWLLLPRAGRPMLILDVYVPARIPQVQLACYWAGAPSTYRAGPARTDIREDVVEALVARMSKDLADLLRGASVNERLRRLALDADGAAREFHELSVREQMQAMHETFSKRVHVVPTSASACGPKSEAEVT